MVTVEEMRCLPEPKDGKYYELRDGRPVKVKFPGFRHQRLARKLMLALHSFADANGEVYAPFYFRALPEYDVRRVDVAYVSAERYAIAIRSDDFFGAPDLVVQILPGPDASADLDEKRALCMANGCQEFWVADLESKSIQVTRRSDCGLPISVGRLEMEELFG